MKHQHDDGGREAAGFKGKAGDCVTRAIAIATGKPYADVYDDLMARNANFRDTSRSRAASRMKSNTVRNGVFRKVYQEYLESLGWEWVPTMKVGEGCRVHLRQDELPGGNIIVRLSRHLAAVKDGVLHDTHDCSRGGTRCVYGYFRQATE